MNAQFLTVVFSFLNSPAGQALVLEAETEVKAAVKGLIKAAGSQTTGVEQPKQ